MALTDSQSFVRQNLFGGRGQVHIWNLLGLQDAAPFSAALWCELEPGGSVGAHQQQADPEVIVCLSGRGQATVDGHHHPLITGALVYLPFGSTLSIHNDCGDESLKYLIIKASADSHTRNR